MSAKTGDSIGGLKLEQRHGKSRVRVGRVWKDQSGRHHFVEWNVNISLLSNCLPAYVNSDNSDIVATDTIKNTVYVKAKECREQLSPEDFAIILGKHFTSFYRQVSAAFIKIVEKPWERIHIDGQPHEHDISLLADGKKLDVHMPVNSSFAIFSISLPIVDAPCPYVWIQFGEPYNLVQAITYYEPGFKLGSEKHTTEIMVKKSGAMSMVSGIEGLALLKTTQSGFEGFIRDKYTILPETRERMLATEVTASWRYSFETFKSIPAKQFYFLERYTDVKKVLVNTFFGPPKEGVYSPSVQSTLYYMAKAVLGRFPDISSVQLKMPNIHFLPVNLSSKDNPIIVKFEDDVYLPTDEPHGSIEASLTRIQSKM